MLSKLRYFIFLGLISTTMFAQGLLKSPQSSYYTYVYQITNQEAEQIFKKGIQTIDDSFYHSLVDSVAEDLQSQKTKYPTGHYLLTKAEKGFQHVELYSQEAIDVFVLNNDKDLVVQVYDLEGNSIENATVKVNQVKLRFDAERHSYVDQKSNKDGLLKVTYGEYTSFIDLSKRHNNSAFKRSYKKVVYSFPLKYIYLPIQYIVYLPIDGVKSIKNQYPTGTIYQTKNIFKKKSRYQSDYKGYFVFSKPKYKPYEKVKFKTYIVHKKTGKPYHKPLTVVVSRYSKEKKLGEIVPYDKGGYTYDFNLVDSLDLKLDYNYTIKLLDEKENTIVEGRFKYEDYELGKNELTVRVENENHFKGKKANLFIMATDENELSLMDAKVEVIVMTKKISEYYAESVFVPDTLYTTHQDLAPKGETKIVLSDSLFPKASFEYKVKVVMSTSDNEVKQKTKTLQYWYEQHEIASSLQKEELELSYLFNGDTVEKKGKVYGVDAFGNTTLQREGKFPLKLSISPFYESYKVELEDYEQVIKISDLFSALQVYTDRTADSIEVEVSNPRNLPFVYTFYKKNALQQKGYTKDLHFKIGVKDNQNYYFTINYLWGGEVKKENYIIGALNDYRLNLDVDAPQLISPGQNSTIEVKVTDHKGKPVEGVDITAYGITKKFDHTEKNPPIFTKKKKAKTVVNNFQLAHKARKGNLSLDYSTWKVLAGLDSIPYYQFLFPEKGIYQTTSLVENNITQFVPFVVHQGNIEPVKVIYVDNEPVYFAWATIDQPYAVRISKGKHNIRLRTEKNELFLKDIEFEEGVKSIISVDRSYPLPNVKVEDRKWNYSDEELELWSKYTLAYQTRFSNYALLEQKENVYFLNTSYYYRKKYDLVGPVLGQIDLTVLDGYKSSFYFDSGNKYSFSESNISMKPFDLRKHIFQLKSSATQEFYDEVLTKEQIKKKWKLYLEEQRKSKAVYSYPRRTYNGKGKLIVDIHEVKDKQTLLPLNKLLVKLDDPEFIRVYPGSINTFHSLDSGYYQLIYFYSENRYHIEDSLKIHTQGVNYYSFNQSKQYKQDQFGKEVSEIIEKSIYQKSGREQKDRDLIKVQHHYRDAFSFKGEGNIVNGIVYEEGSNTPLPGVNVNILGTNYGTITDLEGKFSIKIPKNRDVLRFSFIGYKEQDVVVKGGTLQVILEADMEALEEIVIIGYGTQSKKEVTGAVASVAVRKNPDETIMIRGVTSSGGNGDPLYVINGKVFTGDFSTIDPNLIQNITILKDAASIAVYGSKGSNGVILIEMSSSAFQEIKLAMSGSEGMTNDFITQAQNRNSIRNNFQDNAFWQPQLKSDKEGKVKFEVTFPDDITKWNTHFLAMNGKKQSGSVTHSIKSYMPLAGQVNLPRFLVASDQAKAIGKSLNYMGDTLQSNIVFTIDQQKQWEKTIAISDAHIDTLSFTSTKDSVALSYTVTSKNGFFDGEERSIPVYPLGIELAKGGFYILETDTTIHLESNDNPTKVYAKSSYLGALESEIEHVIQYRYLCNEQLASKLKTHLSAYAISKHRGEKYKSIPEIEKLIKKLAKNTNKEQLWGWWEGNTTSYWISKHVLEAFVEAQKYDFDVPFDRIELTEKLLVNFHTEEFQTNKLKILQLISDLDPEGHYQKYISELEAKENPSLNYELQLLQLKQKQGLPIDLNSLQQYQQTTMFGNIYYNKEEEETIVGWRNRIIDNDIQNTLLVYQLFKADSVNNHEKELKKIRNYLLEQRKTGYWVNTYTSSKIIETVLPDILKGNKEPIPQTLTISGSINQTVSNFPMELDLQKGDEITIIKSGDLPIYLTQYTKYWENAPKAKSDHFEVNTYFEDQSNTNIKAGNKVNLVVEVDVKKSADYVMVNVPIPAGCSYASKRKGTYYEVHREYFKNEVAIFCKTLKKGKCTFTVELLPRYNGNYHLNPAKAELMYFPTFYGNNELKEVGIQ
ncbi:carboxypeptidase-like regulatory domain-containing protein [Flammeovirga sp. EKP202]|uniref:carboxypeptidase-like regulatory domain-containing protein n=1 Tax=Flammeovirga sp. EKP202 TaxID=2770592 RepID=UPI00165F36BF|nr:carboxypeptidase-like regulatory domain-containing protein [Flammeovirga sp. EKP202]MBD0401600.1 carboxypeptidase-like regulatory domain-containing protein [Flammeovirga sp. EKP202]